MGDASELRGDTTDRHAALPDATMQGEDYGLTSTATYDHVRERDAACVPYRGYDVCGMGPPSSGGVTVGQILGLLVPFDLAGPRRGSGQNRHGNRRPEGRAG